MTKLLEARTVVQAPRERVFAFLSRLENHWALADRWIEVVSLEDDGRFSQGGVVRIRGPLGLSRTARTVVVSADEPRSLRGYAEVGPRTHARVGWDLTRAPGGTQVRLSARVERAGLLDRIVLAAGGARWMERRLAAVLATLGRTLETWEQGVSVPERELEVART